eukprot:scaffold70899_cov39-Phaeocystis_antarctica.AAC.1
MYWSQTESSKWSLDSLSACHSTRATPLRVPARISTYMSMFARTSDPVPRGTPKKPRVLV